jgi:hypothetical protein
VTAQDIALSGCNGIPMIIDNMALNVRKVTLNENK